jgi:hypothetical protein
MGKKKYNTTKESVVGRLLDSCRTASRREKKVKKGIDQCDVTFELLYQMMETQCWKCIETEIPFLLLDKRLTVKQTNELGLNRLFLPSVDRIDNNKGYTIDNIKIVSQGYNILKNIHSDEKAWEWITSIKLKN